MTYVSELTCTVMLCEDYNRNADHQQHKSAGDVTSIEPQESYCDPCRQSGTFMSCA